jgi:ribonuclease HI
VLFLQLALVADLRQFKYCLMLHDPHAIQILIDGSCYKNPGGLSGCSAIVIYPDDSKPEEQIVDIGVAESNISRMELTACNRSMEWLLRPSSNLGVTRVQIVTDSRYVHDNINRAVGWRRNGRRNFDNRPIENRDLWKRFISLRSKLAGARNLSLDEGQEIAPTETRG